MFSRSKLLALVLILVLAPVSLAKVEKYDSIGQVVQTRAVFDLNTGGIKFVESWTHLVGENIIVYLPPGVLTDDPFGTGDHYPNAQLVNFVVGVETRVSMDSDPVLIPWWFFTRGSNIFPQEPYQYHIGSRISVSQVVNNGAIVAEKYNGIVTGHSSTKLSDGSVIPVWLVKYGNGGGYDAPIYQPDEDAVPVSK